jgi:aryl-alcohol dehydrogenase-like predicted oxidoreductase
VLVAGRYTLLDVSAADSLLPLCLRRGVAVLAGSVFNGGILPVRGLRAAQGIQTGQATVERAAANAASPIRPLGLAGRILPDQMRRTE